MFHRSFSRFFNPGKTTERKKSDQIRTIKYFSLKAGMIAHPVTQVIGEQALVDILDLSKVAWTCWGCFYTQQWAGAEYGE